MKILPINNYTNNNNTNFKAANKFCRYSIYSLIASSSLFMLSNAIDTFKSSELTKETTSVINTAASVLGIAGTAMGIFGIEKEESHDKHR